MPDLVTLLRRLADEYEKEEAGEQSATDKARLDKLEEQVAAASKGSSAEERIDAVTDLTDEEWELLQAHRAGNKLPSPPPPDPEDKQEVKLRRERLTRSIPRIHNGDDEPDTVEYEDAETGETRKRPGRKRNLPYEYEITEEKEDVA